MGYACLLPSFINQRWIACWVGVGTQQLRWVRFKPETSWSQVRHHLPESFITKTGYSDYVAKCNMHTFFTGIGPVMSASQLAEIPVYNNNHNPHRNKAEPIQGHEQCIVPSSVGSYDECWNWECQVKRPPSFRPSQSTWAVSPPVGCYCPHPPSPLTIITQH